MSNKQQRRLARKEKKKNRIIEKVEQLEGKESKESEIDVNQKEKNKDTDCLGKIPMGAEDSETGKEKEKEIDEFKINERLQIYEK